MKKDLENCLMIVLGMATGVIAVVVSPWALVIIPALIIFGHVFFGIFAGLYDVAKYRRERRNASIQEVKE